eukprot:CAMPEP_0173431926 /NCGR_PEP_ID=MMETSP1357-20121228/9905_1 /TAXON_ID=77926 /ORGANISM="Hemiselmis rufescens, Strain PCC563" /LENGTH=75 /DNA_ID=CAMNT_0014396457 /DNA_START=23 /DNA_END=247 /DNA_ORIENTATION=-
MSEGHHPPVFEFAGTVVGAPLSSLRARRAKKFDKKETRSFPALAAHHTGICGGFASPKECADAWREEKVKVWGGG